MSHRTIRLASPVVLVPGLGGSGAAHWQSRWQKEIPDADRISPSSWEAPQLNDWMAALDRAIGDRATLLVAHSLGCLLAIAWARQNPSRAAGIFLVALPDAAAGTFPLPDSAFASIDVREPLRVPCVVIASDDDDYCAPERSAAIATDLGAGWLSVGAVGHINAESGLGRWRTGQNLLVAFDAGVNPGAPPRG